jgi:hypothetical protein
MRVFLYRHTPFIVGSLMLYAGLYKLIHPAEATSALIALEVGRLPASLAIIAITVLELYLGILLLAKADLTYAIAAATVLFLLFAAFLCYLSTLAHPPSCGCMGLTAVFSSNRQGAFFGLARNCGILWLLQGAYGYYGAIPKTRPRTPS